MYGTSYQIPGYSGYGTSYQIPGYSGYGTSYQIPGYSGYGTSYQIPGYGLNVTGSGSFTPILLLGFIPLAAIVGLSFFVAPWAVKKVKPEWGYFTRFLVGNIALSVASSVLKSAKK